MNSYYLKPIFNYLSFHLLLLLLLSLFTKIFIFIVISLFSFLHLSIILILILFIITSPWSIRSSLIDVLDTSVWSFNLINWDRIFRNSFSIFSIKKLLLCLRISWSIKFCNHLNSAFGLYYCCLRFIFSFINFL